MLLLIGIILQFYIFGSIVVSIPACHAGDRGSIPRWGHLLILIFWILTFKNFSVAFSKTFKIFFLMHLILFFYMTFSRDRRSKWICVFVHLLPTKISNVLASRKYICVFIIMPTAWYYFFHCTSKVSTTPGRSSQAVVPIQVPSSPDNA